MSSKAHRVLTVVMDGIGLSPQRFGNAVACAHTPTMNQLQQTPLATSLYAHGPWVGLPSSSDIGNSEVGHNAIGGGRIIEQGASLIQKAFEDGSIFKGCWVSAIEQVKTHQGTLHLLGLLSDGNVHSHEHHLHQLIDEGFREGIPMRLHILTDGRDVPDPSAEVYVATLEKKIEQLKQQGCDIAIASGGGRMTITMDRYEADWQMVHSGWNTHVHGIGNGFPDAQTAIRSYREQGHSDQLLPPFVITDEKGPCGPIKDGDSVILFNFRGDRALEICKAFENEDKDFPYFHRGKKPQVFFAGMMQYDGDENIPKNYLVAPPVIEKSLGEHLASLGIRQYACSETQKYGHVTYFWNGNRSGFFDASLENYVEIPSDHPSYFQNRPWMKAVEITEQTIQNMKDDTFDFGRINYANGDMVGHTGDFESSIIAVQVVDQQLQKLITAAYHTNTTLIITADHGNCDDMFQDGDATQYPNWENTSERPAAKTAHSLAKVPLWIVNPKEDKWSCRQAELCLANLANTILQCMGLPQLNHYEESVLTS